MRDDRCLIGDMGISRYGADEEGVYQCCAAKTGMVKENSKGSNVAC